MLDLLLILIPAVIIVMLLGWWTIKDMSPRSKSIGKILLTLIALSVAGIIVLSFFGGVAAILTALVITGYKLYKRRPR